MVALIRTDASDVNFRELVFLLDEDLRQKDGEEHTFYAQFNKIDNIQHVIVAYLNNLPVGCGAIKPHATGTGEVKRMYVKEDFRGQGIAMLILRELEIWAAALGYADLVLETGKAQPDAIRLYQKSGYITIPNYGQYAGVENSVCMKKQLPLKADQEAEAL